jgi:hypothetical protein
MGEEIMSEWISIKAAEEQNRLNRVNEFQRATEKFLLTLEQETNNLVSEYRQHFPDEQIEVRNSKAVLEVIRRPHKGGFGLGVRAYGDPIGQAFIYEIPLSEGLNRRIPATAHNDGLRLVGEIPIQHLLEFMLMPIFFPAFAGDSGVLRFLEQEFRPR